MVLEPVLFILYGCQKTRLCVTTTQGHLSQFHKIKGIFCFLHHLRWMTSPRGVKKRLVKSSFDRWLSAVRLEDLPIIMREDVSK